MVAKPSVPRCSAAPGFGRPEPASVKVKKKLATSVGWRSAARAGRPSEFWPQAERHPVRCLSGLFQPFGVRNARARRAPRQKASRGDGGLLGGRLVRRRALAWRPLRARSGGLHAGRAMPWAPKCRRAVLCEEACACATAPADLQPRSHRLLTVRREMPRAFLGKQPCSYNVFGGKPAIDPLAARLRHVPDKTGSFLKRGRTLTCAYNRLLDLIITSSRLRESTTHATRQAPGRIRRERTGRTARTAHVRRWPGPSSMRSSRWSKDF